MLNLEKIYIDNFKGISQATIVEFSDRDLVILDGPNGFGKTTLFDVIELCLRGRLERTTNFGKVQKNNSDYSKPFYQNLRGKHVIVKVQFKDSETGATHILVKFLDKDHNGRIGTSKSFKPDAWGILKTYYSQNTDIFSAEFSTQDYEEISQEEIDNIFYGSPGLSLLNLFPLFNYLQQEDNIFFLRKDEEDKKQELNFLFQAQNETREIEAISDLHTKLKSVRDVLTARIQSLGESSALPERVAYVRLHQQKDVPYDIEEPFVNINAEGVTELLNTYSRDIQYLSDFLTSFDLAEFKKSKLKDSLTAVERSDRLLTAFVLQRLMMPERYDQIVKLSVKRNSFLAALRSLEKDQADIDAVSDLGIDESVIAEYYKAIEEKDRQQSNFTHVEGVINEIIEVRDDLFRLASSLQTSDLPQEHCPLCDTKFPTREDLLKSVEDKTEVLISYNKEKLGELTTLNKTIQETYREPFATKLESFLNHPANDLDPAFYSRLVELKGNHESIVRFMAVLNEGELDYSEFIIDSNVSNDILNDIVANFKSALAKTIAEIVPDETKLISKHLFKEIFDEKTENFFTLEEIDQKRRYISYKYDEARLLSLNTLTARLEQVSQLEIKIHAIKVSMSAAVSEYKSAMIEKVKLPFYLYSGKILQNYQQGFGIFLEMSPGTNKVRFLTNSDSDHDVIHHLSSGQLAVVSIAFCLSLNKVYSTSNGFKFIAIDDPIQTLDEVNVHSLIELMRYEFKGYQIVLSTHDDDFADYMKYKFNAFGFRTKKLNVQKELYS